MVVGLKSLDHIVKTYLINYLSKKNLHLKVWI